MTLVEQVDHLRRLAMLDPGTTVFDLALVGVLEDLAATVDKLAGEEPEHGLGSI